MPIVQFRNDPQKIDLTRKMFAPKRSSIEAWFKEARKVIPQIPNPKQTDWQLTTLDLGEVLSDDDRFIKFEMFNSVGERCHIVIDRSIPGGI